MFTRERGSRGVGVDPEVRRLSRAQAAWRARTRVCGAGDDGAAPSSVLCTAQFLLPLRLKRVCQRRARVCAGEGEPRHAAHGTHILHSVSECTYAHAGAAQTPYACASVPTSCVYYHLCYLICILVHLLRVLTRAVNPAAPSRPPLPAPCPHP